MSYKGARNPTVGDRKRSNTPLSIKYKTEVCFSMLEEGQCAFKDRCSFAHTVDELRYRQRHPNYKSVLCRDFWNEGYCRYGRRCGFIHQTTNPVAAWKAACAPEPPKPSSGDEEASHKRLPVFRELSRRGH